MLHTVEEHYRRQSNKNLPNVCGVCTVKNRLRFSVLTLCHIVRPSPSTSGFQNSSWISLGNRLVHSPCVPSQKGSCRTPLVGELEITKSMYALAAIFVLIQVYRSSSKPLCAPKYNTAPGSIRDAVVVYLDSWPCGAHAHRMSACSLHLPLP